MTQPSGHRERTPYSIHWDNNNKIVAKNYSDRRRRGIWPAAASPLTTPPSGPLRCNCTMTLPFRPENRLAHTRQVIKLVLTTAHLTLCIVCVRLLSRSVYCVCDSFFLIFFPALAQENTEPRPKNREAVDVLAATGFCVTPCVRHKWYIVLRIR